MYLIIHFLKQKDVPICSLQIMRGIKMLFQLPVLLSLLDPFQIFTIPEFHPVPSIYHLVPFLTDLSLNMPTFLHLPFLAFLQLQEGIATSHF